ncbi:DUF547 domain-containing protein [bacterium]|nr:DUF547 domain-containing protein [bacterium]
MRFTLPVLILVLLLAGCSAPKMHFGAPPDYPALDPKRPFDHLLLDEVLAGVVDPIDGRVDYELLEDVYLADIDAYLAAAGDAPADRWSVGDQKTFWINVHNAAVLRLIMNEWPMRDLAATGTMFHGDLLDSRLWLAGQWRSPRDIEALVLRRFGDPRAFFAMSCGTMDSPVLRNEAYHVETIDIRLNLAADEFLHRPDAIRLEHNRNGGTAVLSSYFQQHREAFAAKGQSLLEGLARYRPDLLPFKDYAIEFRASDGTIRATDLPPAAND